MKLLKIISLITQTEISKFYNILTNIITNIDESINLEKNTDAEHFVKTLSKTEVYEKYKEELSKSIKGDILLDIVSDIVVRDGNSIMSRDWFKTLLEKEVCALKERIDYFGLIFKGDIRDIEKARIRDYTILLNCTKIAYTNDLEKGAEARITLDELSILRTLKNSLELSNDEFRTILFYATGTKGLDKYDVDEVIKKLHDAGIAFYKKNRLVIYVPDEIISILREIKNINLADKYTRRILKCLDDKMINKVKKLHGIKEVERHKKIEAIIKQGVSIESVLSDEIFDDEVKKNDKKKIINEIIESKLEIHLDNSGKTVDEKISNLIKYFNNLDKDPNIGIARDGYEKLLLDLKTMMKNLEQLIRAEFEIEPRVELTGETLLDYNVRPKDVLYLLPITELKKFCLEHNISYRGKNIINSILANYRESENIYIENFTLIANNDINGLKNNGVNIKTEEMGLAFENVTKAVFRRLGINVNDELRKEINTKTNKTDIILDLEDSNIVIVECKSSRKDYSKFSSVTRQLKSYVNHCQKNGYKVKGAILISGSFTDDFIQECKTFYEFNVTLIDAQTLISIYEEFKQSKLKEFPVTLFRHGLIQEEIISKALKK